MADPAPLKKLTVCGMNSKWGMVAPGSLEIPGVHVDMGSGDPTGALII